MKLSEYIPPVDLGVILFHLAGVGGLLGIVLILPCLVSLVFQEYLYTVIFCSLAVICMVAGFGGRRARNRSMELEITEALIVTALSYLLCAVIGAVAFLPVTSPMNGFFESMSGFTTTGLSMLDESTLPLSLHFFRAYAQWLGGLGIIIVSLVILLRPGKTAIKLYSTEYGEKNIIGSVVSTAKVVIRVYAVITGIGFLAYLAAGMGLFDGVIHILTTISTGGFSYFPESIGHYESTAIPLTVTLFMILGAVSFPLYYVAVKGGIKKFFQNEQVRTLILLFLVGGLIFTVSFGSHVHGIFQSASAITTTGFNTVPTAPLSEADKLVTTVFMIIGGCTGSTAGGIKILRLLMLVAFVRLLFYRSVLPAEAEIPLGIGENKITKRGAVLLAAFFTTYLGILLISTLALLWIEGYGLTDTLFEVASAEGTVGMSVGITSPGLCAWSKLILIFNMWVGRLEILPVLVALNPQIWIKKFKTVRK